ncbi:hypothetical protein [Symmachiella dynata]|uniref:hypothetical protein n=1 Tax=Symmachiella dynata TaxID=2527995 RepID=UPI0030EE273E
MTQSIWSLNDFDEPHTPDAHRLHVAVFLIFVLLLFGVSDGVSLMVFTVLMFGCHLVMMRGHQHGGDSAEGDNHASS